MKIENWETYKGSISADTFTFPNAPRVFDVDMNKFVDRRAFAYAFTYFGLTDPLKSGQGFVLNGQFNGSNKNTDFRSLHRQFNSQEVKKLYFSSDKFAIGFGTGLKRTHTGGRTNFIDYVANFVSPFGVLFGDDERSGLEDSSTENSGDAFTPFTRITGHVTKDQTVVINDSDGNGFTFVASDTGNFNLRLIYLTDSGDNNRFTEYWYGEIGGVAQSLFVSDNSKSIILGLESGESPDDIFSGGTIENITPTFYWHDGYSSD